MFERQHIDRTTNRLQWLERLVSLFKAPSNHLFPNSVASPICESIVTEEPMPEQFCTHTRFQRWLAHARKRLFGSDLPVATGAVGCPICGLLSPDKAEVESVLMVWFHDGEAFEYCFASHSPDDCYRIADNALHINLEDAVLSYSLDTVSAVQFRKRRIPPPAPEVLAAEQIIAGKYEQK